MRQCERQDRRRGSHCRGTGITPPGLERLWTITKGRPEVVIAVLDGPVEPKSVPGTSRPQRRRRARHACLFNHCRIERRRCSRHRTFVHACLIPIFGPHPQVDQVCTQEELAAGITRALDQRRQHHQHQRLAAGRPPRTLHRSQQSPAGCGRARCPGCGRRRQSGLRMRHAFRPRSPASSLSARTTRTASRCVAATGVPTSVRKASWRPASMCPGPASAVGSAAHRAPASPQRWCRASPAC